MLVRKFINQKIHEFKFKDDEYEITKKVKSVYDGDSWNNNSEGGDEFNIEELTEEEKELFKDTKKEQKGGGFRDYKVDKKQLKSDEASKIIYKTHDNIFARTKTAGAKSSLIVSKLKTESKFSKQSKEAATKLSQPFHFNKSSSIHIEDSPRRSDKSVVFPDIDSYIALRTTPVDVDPPSEEENGLIDGIHFSSSRRKPKLETEIYEFDHLGGGQQIKTPIPSECQPSYESLVSRESLNSAKTQRSKLNKTFDLRADLESIKTSRGTPSTKYFRSTISILKSKDYDVIDLFERPAILKKPSAILTLNGFKEILPQPLPPRINTKPPKQMNLHHQSITQVPPESHHRSSRDHKKQINYLSKKKSDQHNPNKIIGGSVTKGKGQPVYLTDIISKHKRSGEHSEDKIETANNNSVLQIPLEILKESGGSDKLSISLGAHDPSPSKSSNGSLSLASIPRSNKLNNPRHQNLLSNISLLLSPNSASKDELKNQTERDKGTGSKLEFKLVSQGDVSSFLNQTERREHEDVQNKTKSKKQKEKYFKILDALNLRKDPENPNEQSPLSITLGASSSQSPQNTRKNYESTAQPFFEDEDVLRSLDTITDKPRITFISQIISSFHRLGLEPVVKHNDISLKYENLAIDIQVIDHEVFRTLQMKAYCEEDTTSKTVLNSLLYELSLIFV